MIPEDIQFITNKLKELGVWDKLQGKRILMTGGTGFIGRWFDIPGLDIVRMGKEEFSKMCNHARKRKRFDYIIHGAPVGILASYELGADVDPKGKILFISSGAVYDDPETEIAKEKKDDEHVLSCFADRDGIDYVIARVFSVAGYNPRPGRFALDTFIRQGMWGYDLMVTHPESIRSYVYGADLAVWLLYLLVNETGVHDVCGHHMISVEDLAKRIASMIGVNVGTVTGFPTIPPDPRPVYMSKNKGKFFMKDRKISRVLKRSIKEYRLHEETT